MLAPLQTHFHPEVLPYTGDELRPHFLLSQFRIKGSGILAFHGPCEVKTESLVDWEDRLVQDFIRAREMVHFIGEFFGLGLGEGVWLQRLFMAQARDLVAELSGKTVRRDGDDLFWNDRKLSVSIVTASPVSVLLHVGINIDATGAPVSAAGLKDIDVNATAFTRTLLSRIADEWASVQWACTKVRPVM